MFLSITLYWAYQEEKHPIRKYFIATYPLDDHHKLSNVVFPSAHDLDPHNQLVTL